MCGIAGRIKKFWRNKAEQSGTVELAEGFWGGLIELFGMAWGLEVFRRDGFAGGMKK